MTSTASIEELVTAKYLCESSTLNFTRYFFKQRFSRKFIIGEHHKKICEALDKVISGEIKKMIINIAPRYGKTELAVKNFMAYGLALNPASRFIHLSYSDDLALDNSEEVREIVGSPEYQQMFSKVKIKPKSDSKKKWYTTKGGGVYATSTAGQVTGFGAGQVDLPENEIELDFLSNSETQFAGALIIDDPMKPEDADSEVVRKRINERWDSTIKNRVNSRNTPIIVIMQRLHEEDLCGYLLKQSPDDWTVLSFPCIKEDGTALWEFKHTIQELNELKRVNEVVFDRQYQQNPQPLKGILFRKGELKYFTLEKFMAKIKSGELKPETILSYFDIADEGTDMFAGAIGYVFKNACYVVDAIYSSETVDYTLPATLAMLKKHKPNYSFVETNNQGGMFIRSAKEKGAESTIMPVRNVTNKHSRIINAYGFIKDYFYFLDKPTGEYEQFMENVFSYQKSGKNTHDDAPDCLAGLASACEIRYRHLFTSAV